MNAYLDSHAHIFSEEFEKDFDEILQRAKENNLTHILAICCSLPEAYKALEIKKTEPMIDIAVGFHPSDVDEITDQMWKELEELAQKDEVVAIGEIGLDYYWVKDNSEKQKELFIRQINLANKVNKPILVHTRDAIQDTYDLMKTYPVNKKGILHCYSSSVEMAQEFIKLGYFISLAGPVTFKNAKVSKEVAKQIGMSHLLIETDCPYLTPTPFRGERNEPAYVKYIAHEIAELKGVELEVLLKQIQKNYENLFHTK